MPAVYDVDGPHVGARRRLDDVLGEARARRNLPPSNSTETLTSPRASLPPVTASMRKSVRRPFMFVAASMARKTASTGPSPSASASNVPCSAWEMVNGGPALASRGGDDPERLEYELALERADLVRGYGLEVCGRYGLLVVRYLLEAREGPLEYLALDVVAELFEGVLEGVAAGVLAEEDVRPLQADVFLGHDLERPPVLEHAVLVDARLVQERVAPTMALFGGTS